MGLKKMQVIIFNNLNTHGRARTGGGGEASGEVGGREKETENKM